MSLLSPDRLLWLLIALPVIGFYILRTRLRRRPVATLLFWDQVFEEKRQRKLWQNLRHWLSLLLQLIFVGLLTFALANPLWRTESDEARNLVLIIDNSASMQAVDNRSGRSRFDEAIDEARQIIRGLRPGETIAMLSAGNLPRVVAGVTDFGPAAEEALETIQPTDGPTRIGEAIDAARKLAADPSRRAIYIFSDGITENREELLNVTAAPAESQRTTTSEDANAPERQASLPKIDNRDLHWVQVGSSQDNAAITTFQVRRSTIDPIGYALLVEVSNFSDQPLETRLRIELDQTLVDVVPLTIEPNGSWRKTIESTSRQGGVLTASIDSDDGLPIDNQVWAVIPSRPLIPVVLKSDDPDDAFYLRTVLESIPLLQVNESFSMQADATGMEPTDTKNRIEPLVVYSQSVPERLPDGPLLIVHPQQDGPNMDNGEAAWKLGEVMPSPIVAEQNKESPLMQYVNLQNVVLDGARDIQVHPELGEATSLLETADGASVLLAIDRPEGRILILTADLSVADLPLRIAFPVLMTNSMHWFYRQSGEINPALSTGHLASIPWDVTDTSSEATMIRPDGSTRRVTVANGRVAVGPLATVGIAALLSSSFQLTPEADESDVSPPQPREVLQQPDAEGVLVAINLTDASESDLRLPEIEEFGATSRAGGGAPLWFYLVMAAIGLIVGEWWMFNRRVVA